MLGGHVIGGVVVELTGKVALVTGGGRGIGRATALALANAGTDVAVLARSADQLEAVAAEVRGIGRRGLAVPCDVADAAACREAVERTVAALGRLDVLVNNAGGGEERKPTAESDPGRWAHTIQVNLLSAYYVTHAALPHLIAAGGGKVVNVGSGMGHAAAPGNLAYSAAKAGLWMFTRGLAMEVWQHGIDVNEVVPGPVLTHLTRDVFKLDAPPPFAPSERVKGPEEVAELILWLARRRPGGPTGQSFSLARRPID
jgi:3-oxoacyl-[acyl-carrier protein] reductase